MRVARYPSARAFLAAAEPFLLEAEAENALILGVAHDLASGRISATGTPYFVAVHDETGPVVCAFSNRAELVGVTRAHRDGAIPVLAADLLGGCPGMRLIGGPRPTIDLLVQRIAASTGRAVVMRMALRIHELRSVLHPTPFPPGALRHARADELELLVPWVIDFERHSADDYADARAIVEAAIARGGLFIWDDHGPVSMATRTGKTPGGERVSLVYTPPELRGRGYATASVAALSQRMLDDGNRFCCLYTDLANPTSNAIYAKIGYRPVCDTAMYAVESRAPAR